MSNYSTLSFIDRNPIFELIQKYDQDGINEACEGAIDSETVMINKDDKVSTHSVTEILKTCEDRPFDFANVLTWDLFRIGGGTNALRYDLKIGDEQRSSMITFPTIADGTGNMFKPLLDDGIWFYKVSIPYTSLHDTGYTVTGKLSIYKYKGSLFLFTTEMVGDSSEMLSFAFKICYDTKFKILESARIFLTNENYFSVY